MIKEINLSGVTTSPSDYSCPDGDLTYANNLVQEDGSLTPASDPGVGFSIPTGWKLLYLHKQHNFTNVIFKVGTNIVYVPSTKIDELIDYPSTYNADPYIILSGIDDYKDISSVGTDLVIIDAAGIHHCVYKDSTYNILPTEYPAPRVSFGLVGSLERDIYSSSIKIAAGDSTLYYDQYQGMVNVTNLTAAKLNDCSNLEITAPEGKSFGTGYYGINVMLDPNCSRLVYIAVYDTNGNLISSGATRPGRMFQFKISNGENTGTKIIIRIGNVSNANGSLLLYQSTEQAGITIIDESDYESSQIIMAAANWWYQEHALDKGMFIYPFLARAAIKLFDGRYINLSAPCMLIPNTGSIPTLQPDDTTSTTAVSVHLWASSMVCKIQFQLKDKETLEQWKDYITDIVIAVTRPIYTWDQKERSSADTYEALRPRIIGYDDTRYSECAIAKLGIKTTERETITEHQHLDEYTAFNAYVSTTRPKYYIDLPKLSSDDQRLMFEQASTFHIIKTIPIDDILDGKYDDMTTLDISSINLNSLDNYPSLPEDYTSLNKLQPNKVVAYNSRLHLADYTETLFQGYRPSDMCGKIDPIDTTAGGITTPGKRTTYKAIVQITDNQTTYTCENYVCSNIDHLPGINEDGNLVFFFFPHINATRAKIYKYVYKPSTSKHFNAIEVYKTEITLLRHPSLLGCYWYDACTPPAWEDLTGTTEKYTAESWLLSEIDPNPWHVIPDIKLYKPNYMKLSEDNNQFSFTNKRTYTFDSKIQAISSVITPLSTGQAGEFDLYVLTESDGVWSLKINNEGGYTNQVAVTRDTIIPGTAVTQLDSAILFATDRGLMLLQGSQSTCISKTIAKDTILHPATYPYLQSISTLFAQGTDINLSFRQFIREASTIYDYTNQRILVYKPGTALSYAYDLDTGKWTMLTNSIAYHIPGYPTPVVVDTQGFALNISTTAKMNGAAGLILTRPITLGYPNEHKQIDHVRLNGSLSIDHAKMILYGSNDLRTWKMIAGSNSSRITDKTSREAFPCRFLRLAIATTLTSEEYIDSVTFSFRIKNENNLLL